MMTAIARAEAIFREHVKDRLFVQDLALYLRHGYVVTFPDLFGMARPVRRDAPRAKIEDPTCPFADPDTWHVSLAIGPLQRLVHALPFPLQWICFRRKFWSTMKFYPFETFARRCGA